MSSDPHYGAKRHAHQRAKSRNVAEFFDLGEQIEVIIKEPPSENGGEEAVASTSRDDARDVRVFVEPGSKHLHRSDHIKCRIAHVDRDYLKAVFMCKLN